MKKSLFLLLNFGFFAVNAKEINVPKKGLVEYHKKSDFGKTFEPAGNFKKKKSKELIFAIQKHAASHLHYDVRLEIDNVLVSWAVPKGPSTNPADKRLAMMTEDHPLEYATFEGVIPEGEYGAGTIMVWDIGTFTNIKEKNGKIIPLRECLRRGQIEVFLEGKKLHGGYVLVRTGDSESKKWLFIKMHDEYAGKPKNPLLNKPKSALTNRTMKQIAKEVLNTR